MKSQCFLKEWLYFCSYCSIRRNKGMWNIWVIKNFSLNGILSGHFHFSACLFFAFQRNTISAVAITWTAFLRWQGAMAVVWTALSKALTSLSSSVSWAWANIQTSSNSKRSVSHHVFFWASLFACMHVY